MWFRRKPKPLTRAQRWTQALETLEAQPATHAIERVKRFLDLEDADVRHLHTVRHAGEPTLYLFDVVRERRGPAGAVSAWSSWAVMRSSRAISPASFRATPRRESLLESLDASRTGATPIPLTDRPNLDTQMLVLARDANAVKALLSDAVADVMVRLCALHPSATLVVGERHLRASIDTEESHDPGELLGMASDLLLLGTLLQSALPPLIDDGDLDALARSDNHDG